MVTVSFHGRGGRRPSVVGKLGLSLFFLIFFTVGSFFELFILQGFLRVAGQRTWRKTPCTIIASEVREHQEGGEPYAFIVQYRYEYDGRTYEGAGYQRNYSGGQEYSKTQELVEKYPAGLTTSCYVNPTNPSEAVLERDSMLIGLACLFPLIFILIGAGGLYSTWRRRPPEEAQPIAEVGAAAARRRRLGKLALAAFFGVFAIAGGAMLYPLGILPIARTVAAESWVETPCKVLRAEVRDHRSDDGTTYSVYVLYEYEFGGRTYKCDRYDFVGGSSSGYEGKAQIVAAYESTERPICYVDPANPSQAVLKRGFQAKLLFALFPLPFLLVGVGGIGFTLRSKRLSAGGGGSVGRIGPMGPMGPADGGPQVLRAANSPRAKFVGILIAAVVWNGIVSVAVLAALGKGVQGGAILFLLLFVAAGLGLAAAAVYQFLALFNPRPTIELSKGLIPLGGAAEMRWTFSGRAGRIQELAVTLRGVEEARYRSGKNTHTDRSTFYEMELYRTADPYQIASGQIGFVMPTDTMHSFESTNNKILWSLDIHGSIKSWPDVKESFKINVTPGAA